MNGYNPEIGTFVFLGGNVGSASGVSAGFGKTLKSGGYLGIYYGGDLVNGGGNNDHGDPATKNSYGTWNNRVALLLGNSGIGGIRLDLVLTPFQTNSTKVDGDPVGAAINNYSNGTAKLALSWGKNIGKASPHATLGFLFPQKDIDVSGGDTNTTREDAALYVKAGTGYYINPTSSFSGDLIFAALFGEKTRGDSPETGTKGAYYLQVPVDYTKTIAVGETGLSLKLRPNATIGLAVDNSSDTTGAGAYDAPAEINFGIKTGVKAGLEWNLPKRLDKFTLYTGVDLQLFEFTTTSYAGGDTANDATSWNFTGIGFGSTNLDIGLTFVPIENLTIGIGGLLASVVTIDPDTMQATGGNWDITKPFDGIQLDLTVSYKF
jgi:hypothetical protein